MSTKTKAKKLKLLTAGKRTKYAPIWLIPKIFGKTKKVHPMRITAVKRNWRRTKLKK